MSVLDRAIETGLEFAGRHYGRQDEVLVCLDCSVERPWLDDSPRACECGGELHVDVPKSEELVIRYRCWLYDQKWLPQGMAIYGDDGNYHYVQWLGREWRKRPCEPLFGGTA